MAAEDRNGEVFSPAGSIDCSPRESSFDELAKGLAYGTLSRRRALRLMGAALIGAAVASTSGVAWAHHKPDHPVPPGQARRCLEGEVKCRNTCCGPEDLCCNGECTNVSFNRNNCGACGNVCAEGEDCCGSAGCVALNTPEHCGGCFQGCHEAEICVNGTCQCPEPGQTLCANVCCPEGHCVIDETGSFTCVA
jgi:hypothetical protein